MSDPIDAGAERSAHGVHAAAPDPAAVVVGPDRRGGATAAAWLGCLGVVLGVFVAWGGVVSAIAIVLAVVARPADTAARNARITGLVTGLVGVALSGVWVLVYLVISPTRA